MEERSLTRWELHQEVLNSGKPYPTNVGTPIGEQSAEYKRAKRLSHEKRRRNGSPKAR